MFRVHKVEKFHVRTIPYLMPKKGKSLTEVIYDIPCLRIGNV